MLRVDQILRYFCFISEGRTTGQVASAIHGDVLDILTQFTDIRVSRKYDWQVVIGISGIEVENNVSLHNIVWCNALHKVTLVAKYEPLKRSK